MKESPRIFIYGINANTELTLDEILDQISERLKETRNLALARYTLITKGKPANQDFKPASNLSEREKRRKKRLMLKKLEEWKDKGMLKDSGNFSMDSNYDEIEDEYYDFADECDDLVVKYNPYSE